MAKESGWLGDSKRVFGHDKGGGSSEQKHSAGPSTFHHAGKKNGGVGGPTDFGNSKGGGKGPVGKDRPQNNPRGIGLKSKSMKRD
jgi:hypothetical protein